MKEILKEVIGKSNVKLFFDQGILNFNFSVGEFKLTYRYEFKHAQTEQK